MWSWMRVRAAAASAAVIAVDDAAVLARRRADVACQSAIAVDARAGVALDAAAEAGHRRGDHLVAGCLGEGEVERGVEREELGGREVGGVHGVEQDARRPQVGLAASPRRGRPRPTSRG